MKPEITYITQYWSDAIKQWLDDESFKTKAAIITALKKNRKGYPEHIWKALEVRTTRKVLEL